MEEHIQNKVETLLKAIEEDMEANQQEINEKIPSFISDYRDKQATLIEDNSRLLGEIKELQILTQKQSAQEKDLDVKYQQLNAELETKIDQFNEVLLENADKLTALRCELDMFNHNCDTLNDQIATSKIVQIFNKAQNYPKRIGDMQSFIKAS